MNNQEFRNQIVYTLLDKFNRNHTFEDLTEEVADRIYTIACKLSPDTPKQPTEEQPTLPTPSLDTKICLIKLLPHSVRVKLMRANIRTLGDLTNLRVSDLARLRHFGQKTTNIIEEYLHTVNLKLQDE